MRGQEHGNNNLHNITQLMARELLNKQGYTTEIEKRIKIHGKGYILDVYGIKNGDIIIIECGHSAKGKLGALKRSITGNIYIWPLNMNEPILWESSMELCKTCGSILFRKNIWRENAPKRIIYNPSTKHFSQIMEDE